MSRFQLASSSASFVSSNDSSDDEDNLPYPAELSRNDFLAQDFDPQTYLSTLRNRHQTLEDLRTDLRQRSQLLNKELLDLVNGNYEEFLSLGSDLKGGEEKVEGVRVGLLGFRREVEGIKKGVRERADEVAELVAERKALRRDAMLGRNLLEVGERIDELEESLGITPGKEEEDEEEDVVDDDDDDADAGIIEGIQVGRLRSHIQQYVLVVNLINRVGPEHPFILSQKSRMEAIKKTILLDLTATLKQAKGTKANNATLAIVQLYADIGAEQDSLRVLKGG